MSALSDLVVDAIAEEKAAAALVRLCSSTLARVAAEHGLWRWGDGEGGWLRSILEDDFRAHGLVPLPPASAHKSRLPLPVHVRALVFARDSLACVQCHSPDNLSVDHIVPLSRGGTDDVSNLKTLCRSCNSKKGKR